MFSISAYLSYCIINAFTPGPGNLLAFSSMARHGLQKNRRLLFGIFAGYYTVQLLCALAIYFLGKHFSAMLDYLRYFGAVYIIWLAVHIVLSKPAKDETEKAPRFLSGFLLQLVNIKIYFFGITVLTGYITPISTRFPAILASSLFVATTGVCATIVWAFFGNAIQHTYHKHYRSANIIMALLLLYSAYTMLFHI